MTESQPATTIDAAALFQEHAGFVARFLARLGVAPSDIDDVLQEVFLVVHARGGYVEGPAKPTSYLGATALRAASSYRRRQKSGQARASSVLPDELAGRAANPVECLERSETSRELERALATLDPVLSATLLLVDQEGESCTSVAASMAAPVGTVYWRLHKARRALRAALESSASFGRASSSLRKQVR